MSLPTSTAGRIAAIFAAAVALLLVVTQIFLPKIGEGAIEDRLTENGGVAEVSLSATPAARLLWGDGDRIKVAATGLELDFEMPDRDVLEELDAFGEVEILVSDSRVGPVEVERFVLTREGGDAYTLQSLGTSAPSDLAEFFAEDADLPGADILGGLLGATGVGGVELDVELDMRLVSDEGRIRVIEGGSELAGIPTGPLGVAVTQAILEEL